MKSLIFKSNYKPTLKGYLFLRSFIMIVDGIISLFCAFFNYECDLHVNFCTWNILNDIKHRKHLRKLINKTNKCLNRES